MIFLRKNITYVQSCSKTRFEIYQLSKSFILACKATWNEYAKIVYFKKC